MTTLRAKSLNYFPTYNGMDDRAEREFLINQEENITVVGVGSIGDSWKPRCPE